MILNYNRLRKIKCRLQMLNIYLFQYVVNEQHAFQNRIFYHLQYVQRESENETSLQNKFWELRILILLFMM